MLSRVLSLLGAVLFAACSTEGPGPGQEPLQVITLTSLSLTPELFILPLNGTKQLTASGTFSDGSSGDVTRTADGTTYVTSGGTVSASGVYTSPGVPGTYTIVASNAGKADTATVTVVLTLVSVSVSPKVFRLRPNADSQLVVEGRFDDGSTKNVTESSATTFETTGGSVSLRGRYFAPATEGAYRIIATNQGHSDTSSVTVALTLTSLLLTPTITTLPRNGSVALVLTASYDDDSRRDVSSTATGTTYSATGGTVSSTGVYTAPATSGTYRITATYQGITATATVNVTLVLVSVSLTPSTAKLARNGTQPLTVTGTYDDNSIQNLTTAIGTIYTASGGAVSPAGVYTAPGNPGTYMVIAANSGKADTSMITVVLTLTSIALAPASSTVPSNGTQQLRATCMFDNGSSSDCTATSTGTTYSTNGGSVSPDGLYRAPAAAGTYTIVAQNGGKSASSTVTVTPTLISLAMTPASATITLNGTQPFVVTGKFADGSTRDLTNVSTGTTYSVTGGTVSSVGAYRSPGVPGTYTITASSGGKSAVSTVTVTNVFRDDFAVPGNKLDLNWWTTEFGAASFLGRTQLPDWVRGSGKFVVGAAGAELALNTFNPTGNPQAATLYGTHAKTIIDFQPTLTSTVVLSARLQLTTVQPGLVFGIYFYQCHGQSCLTHDEIDIEVVTNFLQAAPYRVQLNRYADEGFGAGNGSVVNLPASFNPTAAHDWTIRWSRTSIEYLVDGVSLGTVTTKIPQGAMKATVIVWGPDTLWSAAYSANLVATGNASQNQVFKALLKSITVSVQ